MCRGAHPTVVDPSEGAVMSQRPMRTPMPSQTTRTALDAYMAHHAAALALVERIGEALANHDDADDPETLHWGHVGDIAETEHALQQIADRMFAEGEYASERQ
jgi:hypothetical protein